MMSDIAFKPKQLGGIDQQKGFSAWLLLPWLLFFVLSFVFWWFVHHNSSGQVEPLTTAQIEPLVMSEPAPQDSVKATDGSPVVSYHDAVAKASLSVVNIYTTQTVSHPYYDDPIIREFFERHGQRLPQSEGTNLGSGVIVSSDGYIVTNSHVIDKADEIVVVLGDGRRAEATVVGQDIESDLAVIRITLDQLIPITFKNDPVKVGDVTLAIGNPFGVGQTVTQGIVSATGRGVGMNTFEDFVQTDAAINPGNSGGALVDAAGHLVGINTMIYSRSGGSMGLGFAIPTVIVQKVMTDIIATGRVSRGWLGIEIGRGIPNPASLEMPSGVVVARVMPAGPADKAGVLPNDVIVGINGVTVNEPVMLMRQIANLAPNTSVPINIKRNGASQTIMATLEERPFGQR